MTGQDVTDDEPSGEQYLAELHERLQLAGQALGIDIDGLDADAGPTGNITAVAGATAAYLDALSQRPELFTHPQFLAWTAEGYAWAISEILPTTLIRAAMTYRLQVLCRVIQPPELAVADPLTGATVAAMHAAVELLASAIASDTPLSGHHLRRAAVHLSTASAHVAEATTAQQL